MTRKILLILILLLFLAGAAVALYNIISITSEYHAGEQVYEDVQTYAHIPQAPASATEAAPSIPTEPQVTPATESTEIPEETLKPVVYPEVDFAALQQVNPDVVGWIYMEDTKINYPIVQGTDNRYYVSALVDGTYNGAGSIFMDYRNARDMSDRHVILYGHNMKTGTMFANITQYRNQEYYDAHPMGLVVTPEQNYRFEVVAAYVASLADPSWQLEFVDDEDALQWVQDAMERSPFVSRVTPKPGDRMITLSTCSYEFNDARFVLVGLLMED